jgi:hypothetical protein
MTKTIDTLVPDIYQVLRNSRLGKGVELTVEQQAQLGASLAAKTARALNREDRVRPAKTLYMSEIGKPCTRQLWYSVYAPHLGEKLLPHTQFKFLYGDYLEELTLFLAKLAGHEVTNEQELVEFKHNGWTIRGKKDCHIDGVLVDVKSASSFAFKKFQEGLTDENDSFGYRAQLEGYGNVVPPAPRMGWLVVDKQNGTLQWSEHKPSWFKLAHKLDDITRGLEDIAGPPKRSFTLVPEGKSGNEKLGTECSYCPYKQECWKDTNAGYGLRAFSYAGKPVFLGTVVREPKVPEIPLLAVDSETSLESTLEESTTT